MPNPFRGKTTIDIRLKPEGLQSEKQLVGSGRLPSGYLKIYDLAGRFVRDWDLIIQIPAKWNGMGEMNQEIR